MAEISYMYQKQRREFGRPVEFQNNDPEPLFEFLPNQQLKDEYIAMDPYEREIENVPSLSEYGTNTAKIETRPKGQTHVEGGWPAAIDYTDLDDKTKYRKKVEREDSYYQTCKDLMERHVEKYLKQNNAIDIFEEYFVDPTIDLASGPPSAKTVTVFQDPSEVKRTVAKLSWLPDAKKIAIAYCNMKFQDGADGQSTKSHVWDVTNPNCPEMDLLPASPLCCLQYSPKDSHIIAGGSYNGVVQLWDTRKVGTPDLKTQHPDSKGMQVQFEKSVIDDSHKDPVWDLKWLQSKSGEFLTVSTDGQAFIWDVRNLAKPIEAETVVLKPSDKVNDGGPKGVLGGICIDYDAQVGGPSKYMVGTEQGTVLLCNRKGKTPQDKISHCYHGHHGPVYAVQRNPHCSKGFMSVGDWTVRIWTAEDAQLKTPMFTTYYHKAYLTNGTWHPVRPGVFLTTRMDGVLDVWDLLYRQTAPVLSVQISEFSLNTLQCTAEGRHVAVGGVDGNTVLLELSQGIHTIQYDEKNTIEQMFVREASRDRALLQRAKERKSKGRKKSAVQQGRDKDTLDDVDLEGLTNEFISAVRDREEKDNNVQKELEEKRKHLMKLIDEGQEVPNED
eukprot:TRINITY_DN12215_c0_g1_i1.p1 TRINITY_DN12215_c0_g1~~TRINITY_DN12215_c0_g1_i1.p1  ORF type:complete len:611 (+),score=271.88 TRINITY_DN12215_c0_g1_i1:137-1969(+)